MIQIELAQMVDSWNWFHLNFLTIHIFTNSQTIQDIYNSSVTNPPLSEVPLFQDSSSLYEPLQSKPLQLSCTKFEQDQDIREGLKKKIMENSI